MGVSVIVLSFILGVCILYLLFFFFTCQNWPKKKPWYPSGLKPYPIIGHLPQFLRHRKNFLVWSTEFLACSPANTFVFIRPGGIRGVITANPANVEYMLKTHFDNYPKGNGFRANLHDMLGHGIFNSDGAAWRIQRKIASYEFNTRSLRSFVHSAVAHEISTRLLPLLSRSAMSGDTLDLQDTLERFAFDNVCKVTCNVDPASLDPSRSDAGLTTGFAAAFHDAAMLAVGRFRYAVPGFWRVKKLLNIGSERRLRKCMAAVHEFAMQIIRSRKHGMHPRSGGGGDDDVLSRFIANKEHNSDEFLRDIIISFLLAGRDTSSSALTWFFWLISSRPDIERRILAELATFRVDSASGAVLGLDELRQMHYLHAAVTEAMRLYPPVPLNSRVCCADDVLPDGTEIYKGWFFSYNAYAMGRMEAIWGEDFMEYRPERWLDRSSGVFKPESPFKFPAFHGGPRMCLGKEMAYIQMKSIAACVLERFELEVLLRKDACPQHLPSITLRMRGGLPVRVSQRLAATNAEH